MNRLTDYDLLMYLDTHIGTEMGDRWKLDSLIGLIRHELVLRMVEQFPADKVKEMHLLPGKATCSACRPGASK
jgi:hypothetical protein